MNLCLKVVALYFVFSRTSIANPLKGLVDPRCFVVQDLSCPNSDVTFWLYTKETRDNPFQLDPDNINPAQFYPRRPVKILVHGYTGHRDFAPNIPIRASFLDNQDVYIISIDYGPLVRYPCYFAAVKNVPVVSKCLAELINNLVDGDIVPNEDIHIIGFSLGAQVAGQTSKYVHTKLKRITGLDPAKPMFITAGLKTKLDPDDAEFVDVIHTDVLSRGMLRSMGHVDFYPNIGRYQPGCLEENPQNAGSCNHNRAPEFYAESIYSDKGFWGYYCPGWFHYLFGWCYPNERQAIMGYPVNTSSRGKYFLETAAQPPYAQGPIPYKKKFSSSRYYNIEHIDDSNFEPQLHFAFVSDNIENKN